MSKLVLVRHGQASFFTDDYDKLSEMGHRQARVLGEYWICHGEHWDEVYHGSLRRQRESAESCGAAFTDAGLPFTFSTLDFAICASLQHSSTQAFAATASVGVYGHSRRAMR